MRARYEEAWASCLLYRGLHIPTRPLPLLCGVVAQRAFARVQPRLGFAHGQQRLLARRRQRRPSFREHDAVGEGRVEPSVARLCGEQPAGGRLRRRAGPPARLLEIERRRVRALRGAATRGLASLVRVRVGVRVRVRVRVRVSVLTLTGGGARPVRSCRCDW